MKQFAPAKINLYLHILGRRPDGFHELETLMAPISLGDTLDLDLIASGIEFTCSDPALSDARDNLATKAARLFLEEFSLATGIRIHLEKGVPVGAGLGGGSSDAAATLRMLDIFYGTGLARENLMRMASELGSDVPVFVDGRPAWCRGRGEIVEPADFTAQLPLLLLKPAFGVPTPWAYRRWKDSPELSGVRYNGQEFPWGRLENDLERPVFEKYLLLATMKEWLREQPEAAGALMSGSGSTMIALLREAGQGNALAARARERYGQDLWTCETFAGKNFEFRNSYFPRILSKDE